MTLKKKAGALVLGGLTLLAGGLFLFGDAVFEKRYTLYGAFMDGADLPKGVPVELSGAEVGRVRLIERFDGGARAVMSIRRGVDIYQDASFLASSTGVGHKFLQVDQGTPAKGVIPAGSTVRIESGKSE
jgi:ABC-type transporter Mla subunit MlaD